MPVYLKHSEPTWDYTPSGDDATAGGVVLLGDDNDVIGIVVADTEEDKLGAVRVTGVFDFPTDLTDTDVGTSVYLASSGKITETDTDTYAGRCAGAPSGGRIWVAINFMNEAAGS